MKNKNITENRDKYIGGSDIPIILGISPFKTRYELLLEKAGLLTEDLSFRYTQAYIDYGNTMEPIIRDVINEFEADKLIEKCTILGEYRYNSDGQNAIVVGEIKTLSEKEIKEDVREYKRFISQLLFGMYVNKIDNGKLYCYVRDEEFNEVFDPQKLHIYDLLMEDYQGYINMILMSVDEFIKDLKLIKEKYLLENIIIQEEDLIKNKSNELLIVSNEIIEIETKLLVYKELEKEKKKLHNKLLILMKDNKVKKWTTANDIKVTRVIGIPTTSKQVMNYDKLKEENEELIKKYEIEKTIITIDYDKLELENKDIFDKYKEIKSINGRKEYLKVTLPQIK